jgi:hypothetical protein
LSRLRRRGVWDAVMFVSLTMESLASYRRFDPPK